MFETAIYAEQVFNDKILGNNKENKATPILYSIFVLGLTANIQ